MTRSRENQRRLDPRATIVTTSSVTAAADQCLVLTAAAATTVTLPTAPADGTTLRVVVANGRTDNVVARGGSLLMGLAENMTLDHAYAAITLRFVDAATGWRLL
jgi:hypothetical protein